jgi:hypothetical protein
MDDPAGFTRPAEHGDLAKGRAVCPVAMAVGIEIEKGSEPAQNTLTDVVRMLTAAEPKRVRRAASSGSP